MRLRDYLNLQGWTIAEFARRAGIAHRQTAHRYVRGEHVPPKNVMTRIVEITDGAVQPNDFFDLPSEPPQDGEAA